MAVHRHAAVRAAYRERARVLPGAPAKVSVKLATLTIAISAFLDGVLRRDAEQGRCALPPEAAERRRTICTAGASLGVGAECHAHVSARLAGLYPQAIRQPLAMP